MSREPVGEHYVRKLLAMSSCFMDGQGSNVCFSEPCACAQTLLQEIGRPLQDEIERLRAALEHTQIGVNHIALYRTERWPDYGTDHMIALEKLGAGQEYDMWCCWNATMCARAALEPKP